jgi:uncharacterized protein with HEPN domain
VRSERLVRRFEDILENIVRIEQFTAGLDFSAFCQNEKTVFAVLHALLIISEAARRLADSAEELAAGPPWKDIRALGNVLRHQYDDVETVVVWRIVCDDLPALKTAVEGALRDLRR